MTTIMTYKMCGRLYVAILVVALSSAWPVEATNTVPLKKLNCILVFLDFKRSSFIVETLLKVINVTYHDGSGGESSHYKNLDFVFKYL